MICSGLAQKLSARAGSRPQTVWLLADFRPPDFGIYFMLNQIPPSTADRPGPASIHVRRLNVSVSEALHANDDDDDDSKRPLEIGYGRPVFIFIQC